MADRTATAATLGLALALAVTTGVSCGSDSHKGIDGESFTCQAICISADGEVGGESAEFSSSNLADAETDCAANQARDGDLCAGIGPFAGRCSCEE